MLEGGAFRNEAGDRKSLSSIGPQRSKPVQSAQLDAERRAPTGKTQMQNHVRFQLLEGGCQSPLNLSEAHRQNACMKRDGEPRKPPAMAALQLADKGHGGVRRGAWKGAESGHENRDHGASLTMQITKNCFGPILVTFPVQTFCEQKGSLTFRQAIPCLMSAASARAAAIPED